MSQYCTFWLRSKYDPFEEALDGLQLEKPPYCLAQLDYIDLPVHTIAIDHSSGAWTALSGNSDGPVRLTPECCRGELGASLYRRNCCTNAKGLKFYPPVIETANGRNLIHSYLILVETTNRCNLRCAYCFKQATPKGIDMSSETARNIALYLKELNLPNITVEFAGGEPLLNRKAIAVLCEALSEWGARVRFTMQTNATLVDDDAVALALKWHINVSVSLEGRRDDLDRLRPLANGKPSSTCIISGVKKLGDAGILTGAVAVFNSQLRAEPKAFLDLIEEVGVTRIKCNTLLPVGRGHTCREQLRASNESYASFMCDFVEEGLARNPQVLENNTYHIVRRILRRIPSYRCSNSPCDAGFTFLSIRPDGSIWPCDRYTSFVGMRLGHVNEHRRPEDMVDENPVVRSLNQCTVFSTPICSRCNLRSLCGGGCGMERYEGSCGFELPPPQCSFYERYIPWVFDRLLRDETFRAAYAPDCEEVSPR